jgi:precorrin-6Y C5,15-methyltransferase (decarboxylating)
MTELGADGRLSENDIVSVVGIGADGWTGLSPAAQDTIRSAEVLLGSSRQLALIPDARADRVQWPSPMLPAINGLIAQHHGRAVCVLASGDPMFFGVGTTLTRGLGPDRVRVFPHPSSVSLACARLGWALDQVDIINLVGRPVELLHPAIQPNRRLLVLSSDGDTPAQVAALLTIRGYGESHLTVLQQIGGPCESSTNGTAMHWPSEQPSDSLNLIAVECHAENGAVLLPRSPGLPDDAFEHDGQLTKREVRAVTLALLAPVPGQLLWDVGAGAGSIGIEWMRTEPSCRAIAIESRPERVARIERNAASLGVPGLTIITGSAPDALANLEAPDAIFIGGGATAPGTIQTCWAALRSGGRLVVNAVTLDSEALLADWYRRLGGDLVRVSVNRASPLGSFTGWRALTPVMTWTVVK